MAKTEFWNRFGNTILDSPHLTLAAFLGHAPSVAVSKLRSIKFPYYSDFQNDPAYNPNIHKMDLGEDCLNGRLFILCVSAWGADALLRVANACSLLQIAHDSSCPLKLRQLRNEAAFSLHSLIDAPTPAARQRSAELLRQCQAIYRPHEDSPDSREAGLTWLHLGAPWCGLETALGNLGTRRDCGETDPPPSNSTWCARETVWPIRAMDAAAHWSSYSNVSDAMRSTLVSWAVSRI